MLPSVFYLYSDLPIYNHNTFYIVFSAITMLDTKTFTYPTVL